MFIMSASRAKSSSMAVKLPATLSVAAPGAAFTLPANFRMDSDGLWYDRHNSAGERLSPLLICQPFEIVSLARTEQGDGWSFVLRFHNLDDVEVKRAFPRALLAGDGTELRKALFDQGFSLSVHGEARSKLMQALNGAETKNRAILAATTGWTGDSFVLPDQTFAPPSAEPVMLRHAIPGAHYGRAGSFEAWKTDIADKAIGNPLLMLALSIAFAPPLLQKLGGESGVFHFRGSSTAGKTTVARAAGSVWGGGGPLGFAQTWRGTGNALEMMLAGHNDTLIVLDELKQSDPSEIGQVVYAITGGASKGRLNSAAELRARASWRTIALSTGELSLEEHMRGGAGHAQMYAGQALRFLDIEADAGHGYGMWSDLRGAPTAKAFADALNAASDHNYGWAGPAFVQALVDRGGQAINEARILRAEFEHAVIKQGDPAQVRRAAARFALVAAAGELASRLGVTNWPNGAAMHACQIVFERWATGFGRSGSHEEREVIRRIVDAIEKHGASHFAQRRSRKTEDGEPTPRSPSLEQWGWHETRDDGEKVYYFTSGAFKKVFQGIDTLFAARTLDKRGMLVTDKGRLQKKVDISGHKHNLYAVRATVTELLGD
jgi:putative DNA primase/helicase